MAVEPSYYATGYTKRTFKIKGSGLTLLPENAVGLMASNNDDPLMNIRETAGAKLTTIQVINDAEAIADNGRHNLSYDAFLGGIVSNNRQTVYWTNNTRPLP